MLRDYQQKLKMDVYTAWNAGYRNVLAVCPTGSGKTMTMQSITDECSGMTMSIAHRRELVGQISDAAAKVGCYHRIIAPDKIVRLIVDQHVKKYGRSFVHPDAMHMVASVQTINARIDQLRKIIHQCREWNMDEAHHILRDNIWGKCVSEFVNAYGAGYTALAQRGDRKALGRHTVDGELSSGVFDYLVIGPEVQELIDRGFLVPFIIYGPQISSIDTTNVPITASGDYSPSKLSDEARRSTITGDIVRDYLRFAAGKVGATFCVDVGMCEETTAAFRHSQVPVEMITDRTPDADREQIMGDVRCGIVKEVVNVDILGEGVDVPILEVVSLGRPTESLQTYKQQVGRVLRPAPEIGKTHGIIIDHVKNVERHGPPNKPAHHTLHAPAKRSRAVERDPDEIPIRTCPECWRVSESWSQTCEHCGFTPKPILRDRPELVEGDLLLYTPELIARLAGQAASIMQAPKLPVSAGPAAVAGRRAQAARDMEEQEYLRDTIAWWAGVQRDIYGRADSESYVRFYRKFGVDVYTAQSLGASKAKVLNDLIWEDIGNDVDRNHVR